MREKKSSWISRAHSSRDLVSGGSKWVTFWKGRSWETTSSKRLPWKLVRLLLLHSSLDTFFPSGWGLREGGYPMGTNRRITGPRRHRFMTRVLSLYTALWTLWHVFWGGGGAANPVFYGKHIILACSRIFRFFYSIISGVIFVVFFKNLTFKHLSNFPSMLVLLFFSLSLMCQLAASPWEVIFNYLKCGTQDETPLVY